MPPSAYREYFFQHGSAASGGDWPACPPMPQEPLLPMQPAAPLVPRRRGEKRPIGDDEDGAGDNAAVRTKDGQTTRMRIVDGEGGGSGGGGGGGGRNAAALGHQPPLSPHPLRAHSLPLWFGSLDDPVAAAVAAPAVATNAAAVLPVPDAGPHPHPHPPQDEAPAAFALAPQQQQQQQQQPPQRHQQQDVECAAGAARRRARLAAVLGVMRYHAQTAKLNCGPTCLRMVASTFLGLRRPSRAPPRSPPRSPPLPQSLRSPGRCDGVAERGGAAAAAAAAAATESGMEVTGCGGSTGPSMEDCERAVGIVDGKCVTTLEVALGGRRLLPERRQRRRRRGGEEGSGEGRRGRGGGKRSDDDDDDDDDEEEEEEGRSRRRCRRALAPPLPPPGESGPLGEGEGEGEGGEGYVVRIRFVSTCPGFNEANLEQDYYRRYNASSKEAAAAQLAEARARGVGVSRGSVGLGPLRAWLDGSTPNAPRLVVALLDWSVVVRAAAAATLAQAQAQAQARAQAQAQAQAAKPSKAAAAATTMLGATVVVDAETAGTVETAVACRPGSGGSGGGGGGGKESGAVPAAYCGHFVVVVGVNVDGGLVCLNPDASASAHVRDHGQGGGEGGGRGQGGGEGCGRHACVLDAATFDRARFARGTDQDLIFFDRAVEENDNGDYGGEGDGQEGIMRSVRA